MLHTMHPEMTKRTFWLPKSNDASYHIAVVEPNYGLEKVSYMLSSPEFTHRRAASFRLRFLDRKSNYYSNRPFMVSRGFDLFHCWNTIPLNQKFVSSVEMEFPRFFGQVSGRRFRKAFYRLQSDDCRGIWPLSEAALAFVSRRFREAGYDALLPKMEVFRGSILPRPSAPNSGRRVFDPGEPLRILFVGNDGFRKGVYPLISACKNLVKVGARLELIIVGQLTKQSYIAPALALCRRDAEKVVAEAPWVRIVPTLPNLGVRELMDSSHVLAFPTLDESLGWVPIEAAMSEMPTIATDVFAIPEFVFDGQTGWLINLELDEDRRWKHLGERADTEAVLGAERHIELELIRIIEEIFSKPNLVAERGIKAKKMAHNRYHPHVASIELAQLYKNALSLP